MPVMSGKRAFLELLKQEGVEIMFGNPGTTELPLMDALAVENDIRYVLGLQEAVVDGDGRRLRAGLRQARGGQPPRRARARQRHGHALRRAEGGLARSSSPPASTTSDFNVTEPILWADLPTLARPLVKWSAEVHRLAGPAAAGASRGQDRAGAADRPGVPVAARRHPQGRGRDRSAGADPRRAAACAAIAAAVEAAADLLAQAKRPLIIAGDAVAQSRAHAELVELAETARRAGLCRVRANTASFPSSHPLFRGAMTRLAAGDPRDPRPARRAVLGRRRPVHAVAAVRRSIRCRTDLHAHPPRHRPVGARQELSGRGRDPRRPEGDACPSSPRRCASA